MTLLGGIVLFFFSNVPCREGSHTSHQGQGKGKKSSTQKCWDLGWDMWSFPGWYHSWWCGNPAITTWDAIWASTVAFHHGSVKNGVLCPICSSYLSNLQPFCTEPRLWEGWWVNMSEKGFVAWFLLALSLWFADILKKTSTVFQKLGETFMLDSAVPAGVFLMTHNAPRCQSVWMSSPLRSQEETLNPWTSNLQETFIDFIFG